MFSSLLCTYGHMVPYPDGYFKTIISNCVIEHIDRPESFIREITRVLDRNGSFIFTTWIPGFNTSLLLKQEWYVRWKSKILEHRSIKPVNEWKDILQNHGLQVTLIKFYIPPPSLKSLDPLEPTSLIGVWNLNLLNLFSLLALYLPSSVILKMPQRSGCLSRPRAGGLAWL
jgi:SAM-dependent methyltransferase